MECAMEIAVARTTSLLQGDTPRKMKIDRPIKPITLSIQQKGHGMPVIP
jgi:hypothetical protein